MYEREKDVNYEVLRGASTDKIVQSLEEQVQRQCKGPQCVLCLSSCDPRQAANRLACSESPLCSTLCFGLLYSLQELTARKPPQMKNHNFLQIVPFYQIVFVSSLPRKFEISLIYACVHGCMQTVSCFRAPRLDIECAVASILNTPLVTLLGGQGKGFIAIFSCLAGLALR